MIEDRQRWLFKFVVNKGSSEGQNGYFTGELNEIVLFIRKINNINIIYQKNKIFVVLEETQTRHFYSYTTNTTLKSVFIIKFLMFARSAILAKRC